MAETHYYAVIFTSRQTDDLDGYSEMAEAMERLARKQPGFIDFEHAREDLSVTISYWETLEDIQNWKDNLAHLEAQKLGRARWYSWYKTRICKVEREYAYERKES